MKQLQSAMQRLANRYVRWHQDGRKVFVSCFDSRIQSHIRANDSQCACSFGMKEFSIAPSGRLYPCVPIRQRRPGGLGVHHPEM